MVDIEITGCPFGLYFAEGALSISILLILSACKVDNMFAFDRTRPSKT